MHIDLEVPPFRARAPWWGSHLQTLRNKLVRPAIQVPGHHERLRLPLADGSGDRLAAMLDMPAELDDGPLVVLIHGLSGSENSDYMRVSAAYHLRRRRRVLRLNLRGAGPSRASCDGQYHAGCAPDVRDALAALDADLVSRWLFLVGYSLGGNVVINLLAAHADGLDVRGAATVSAAIDPGQASRRLMEPINAIYHRRLLHDVKRECLAPSVKLHDAERQAIIDAPTIRAFDQVFTAPRNGFADVDDYYARTAGWRVAPEIRVPTLLIHARNDPWIPSDPYHALERAGSRNLRIILSRSGGHVGFHGRGHADTWHDRCVGAFLDRL